MQYDLIIVGGGLVGAGFATALSQSHLRIALIDAKPPHSDDPRLFALNMSSCEFLKKINIWPQIVEHASPIHQVHVSHQGQFGSVRLNREDVNVSSLGHVIPSRYIEAALNAELSQLSNCTIYRPAFLQSLQQENNIAKLKIQTEDGEKILQSSLVIGADGTESTVRKQLNIAVDTFDYQQSAIVTRTTLKRSHKNIAYERFEKHGAIAMLPLVNNECATIWTADNDFISHLIQLSDAEFLEILQKEFGYRLGRLQSISKRHRFPLHMVRAEKAVENCVFLLGNSAHTLHPIAAQGFNLALYEVAILAEEIIHKAKTQEMLTASDLQNLSEKTQKQQATSIGVSHRLSQVFSHGSLIANMLIQAGMVGLDISTPIKKRFISGMMGRAGNVSRLLV